MRPRRQPSEPNLSAQFYPKMIYFTRSKFDQRRSRARRIKGAAGAQCPALRPLGSVDAAPFGKLPVFRVWWMDRGRIGNYAPQGSSKIGTNPTKGTSPVLFESGNFLFFVCNWGSVPGSSERSSLSRFSSVSVVKLLRSSGRIRSLAAQIQYPRPNHRARRGSRRNRVDASAGSIRRRPS